MGLSGDGPWGDNIPSVDAGFGTNAFLIKPFTFGDDCVCHTWYKSFGSNNENNAEQYASYFIFGVTTLNLLFYIWNIFRATAGWEEIFVCIVEGFAAAVSAWPQRSNPYTLYLSTGQRVQWMRYFEWLMTCPVILIHLSNLTGMKHHYPLRTMALIVSDISCIVTGVQCALTNGYAKIIWFLVSCCFGLVTYFTAFKVYREAYEIVPDKVSKRLVMTMALIFFISWTGYPLLFALGPEGFQQISYYAMNIGYTLNDLFSKNIWGLLGHTLRLRSFHNSKEGWVVPRSVSQMGSGKSLDLGQGDQQAWVQNMQEFTGNMMLLLAEIHKRVRGEDPADVNDDGPGSPAALQKGGVASLKPRRSLGDLVADDVIRCSKGRKSIGGREVDEEMARKSKDALQVLLGENYGKVMAAMESAGGLPAVLGPRSDSARMNSTDLGRSDSNTHLIIMPNNKSDSPSPLAQSNSQGWVSGRLERVGSGRPSLNSKVSPLPPSRLASQEMSLLANRHSSGGQPDTP